MRSPPWKPLNHSDSLSRRAWRAVMPNLNACNVLHDRGGLLNATNKSRAVHLAIQNVAAVIRPLAAHLVVKLVAIDPLAPDRIAAKDRQQKIWRPDLCCSERKNSIKLVHVMPYQKSLRLKSTCCGTSSTAKA